MKISKPKFWLDNNIGLMSVLLIPFSLFFLVIHAIKRKLSLERKFKISIICIGNIYVGGTGKTPLSIKIANKIDGYVQNYIDNILEIDNQITRTQSWIAVNKKGQKHHAHEHPNTFVSAVYYPVCSSGELVIQKQQSTIQEKYFFHFGIKRFNPANSKTYSIKVKSGDLVIFPGWLTHYCTENNDDSDRIALGVNYFLKGKFGSEDTVDLIEI